MRLSAESAFASCAIMFALSQVATGQPATATEKSLRSANDKQIVSLEFASSDFPNELVRWKAGRENPIFTAEGPGHWDEKIRERGWILRHGDDWRLWFTGYDDEPNALKMLGYATSHDGVHWIRSPHNPIFRGHWVEDVCVVLQGKTYYLFAESEDDNHAELLTSSDGIDWRWIGKLDVRQTDGTTASRRPCGTPTVWIEGDTWYLMYEWMDKGIWLAATKDPMSLVWRDVREEPVLSPGPGDYDKELLAVNQVIRYQGTYYAIYHGSGSGMAKPRTWTTDVARSTDRVHWQKYAGNPIVDGNRSSGVVVPMAKGFRLYTMHDKVEVFESK